MELEELRVKNERMIRQHNEEMTKLNKQLFKERSDNEPFQQGQKKLKLNTGSVSTIEKDENLDIKELREESIHFCI